MSFICHIHNYTEYNEELNVFSAFNPSKWSSGQPTLRRPGSSWGFGALLKGLTSVVDTSCQSRDSNPQPWVTSGFKSNALSIRPDCLIRLYLSNIALLKSRAHANIHIVVIGCKTCFHTAVSFCSLFRYWEESAQHMFTSSSKHRSAASGSFGWVWSTEALSSFKLHPGELNYSLVLQRHAGQTAVLQAITWGHMRSNDYSTTKYLSSIFCCR